MTFFIPDPVPGPPEGLEDRLLDWNVRLYHQGGSAALLGTLAINLTICDLIDEPTNLAAGIVMLLLYVMGAGLAFALTDKAINADRQRMARRLGRKTLFPGADS